MEPTKATISDADLIDVIRKAAYIHFGMQDILAIEELLRRFRNALARPAPEQQPSEDASDRRQQSR
jgi:hypothetical protein